LGEGKELLYSYLTTIVVTFVRYTKAAWKWPGLPSHSYYFSFFNECVPSLNLHSNLLYGLPSLIIRRERGIGPGFHLKLNREVQFLKLHASRRPREATIERQVTNASSHSTPPQCLGPKNQGFDFGVDL